MQPTHRYWSARQTILSRSSQIRGILGAVINELGVRLFNGEWAVGEALPTEAELVEQLDVSRSVIREALRTLASKGLVRSRTSDGTRVQPRSNWRLLDPDTIEWRLQADNDRDALLEDLLRLRLILEPGAVYTATLVATDEIRKEIKEAWQAKLDLESDLSRMDPKDRKDPANMQRFIEVDLRFHHLFLNAAGSELLDQLFSIIEAALTLLIDMQTGTEKKNTFEESLALHEAVYSAFEKRDAPAAEQAARTLVEKAAQDARSVIQLVNKINRS